MSRRAKIVATLGPASREPAAVARLLKAGVDVVRLNLSHGDHGVHRALLRTVRAEAAAQGRFVPVLLDLMGPRYRLGQIPGGTRQLRRGERVRLGTARSGAELPLDGRSMVARLRAGERVLIDNGLVELEIESRRGDALLARVITGGPVSTRKGINLPDTQLPFSISKKDHEDIAFAVAEGADYIAASYVASAADVAAIRRAAARHGTPPPIIAKLERAAALEHLEEIIAEADAVMVARGDLGVEVPLDQVPMLQKRIVFACRASGRPVIVATQMLESMMEHPRPTRAETTDVANAVLEGADALMLSGETAAGRYPVEAVKTMARIVTRAESYRREYPERVQIELRPLRSRASVANDGRHEVADAVCAAAAHAAGKLGIGLIVAFSQGGFTARSIARYRPSTPILIFTTQAEVARRVQLLWGVRPLLLEREVRSLDQVVEVVNSRLRSARLARRGESIILLMGDPIRDKPLTNLMRIHKLTG